MKLISVIVPVYNVEKYLDRCIESIVNQTYKNLEIILVDDGSPDNCSAMCDEWAKKDERIKVIHKENGGGATARNMALDIAAGDYISFVDSDDVIQQEFYDILTEVLLKNDCDIVECDYITEDRLEKQNNPDIIGVFNTHESMKQHISGRYCSSLIWNKLYRKEVVENVRFVPGKLIDDEFFTYRVLGNSKKTVIIDSKLYYYRQQDDSVMHRAYSTKRLVAIEAKVERFKYISEKFPDLADIARVNIAGSCIFHGQMVLKNLKGEEKKKSFDYLRKNYKECNISLYDINNKPLKHKMWFILANISFGLSCRFRNILNIGF